VKSDFSIPALKGLPKAWAYIAGTMPTPTVKTFGAIWPSGIGADATSPSGLLERILMGFVGEVLGGLLTLALCIPASRNLVQSTGSYFAALRTLAARCLNWFFR